MEFLILVGIVIAVCIVVGIVYAIASGIRDGNEKERARRELFGAGTPSPDYKPQFTAEKILSIDYKSMKLRPELYPDCMCIDFREMISVTLLDDRSYYTTTKNHGAAVNTLLGGALAGEVGALAGATSGTQVTTSHSTLNGWTLVICTRILHHKRLEIPFRAGGNVTITKNGKTEVLPAAKAAERLRFELEELQEIIIDESSYDVTEIRKYKRLYDEGILTDEEFTAKKKKILGI